ncbi:uncharacterized protein [Equus asinus]|uniref:uncharacterized protein isoform X2 n=1 Tax=Equus asinus TaxID=9793 RepID=UPI0038F76961
MLSFQSTSGDLRTRGASGVHPGPRKTNIPAPASRCCPTDQRLDTTFSMRRELNQDSRICKEYPSKKSPFNEEENLKMDQDMKKTTVSFAWPPEVAEPAGSSSAARTDSRDSWDPRSPSETRLLGQRAEPLCGDAADGVAAAQEPLSVAAKDPASGRQFSSQVCAFNENHVDWVRNLSVNIHLFIHR